ncbi:MAG: hypothetical protein ACXWTK_01260 [Methylobacter sp.]
MSTKFSDKTVKVSYQKFGIHIYDVKLHNDRWYCTVTITSPLEAPHIDEAQLSPDFDCTSDDEAIEKAKQFAAE